MNQKTEANKKRKLFALMETAEVWARVSHAERLKVGCVISKDNRILATGYNGTLPGEDNVCEDEHGVTKDTVAHAEQNALLFCAKHGIATGGAEMFVTHSPCPECAKLIITAGIAHVYYRIEYRKPEPIGLLIRHGVEVTFLRESLRDGQEETG